MATIQYDVDALRANIDRCRGNIRTFEEAIRKERATIEELEFYIREADHRLKMEKLRGDADVRST